MKHVRGLSFYKMADRFQLKYIQEQCEEIIAALDTSIEYTERAAPVRKDKFMLGRTHDGNPSGKRKEAMLERRIWREFGPSSDYSRRGFLPGVCPFVMSFQVPLKSRQADPWGKIDLLGVAPNSDPVVIELKRAGALDTPLRFLVEAVAYGIALRKVWNARSSQFQPEWAQGLQKAGFPEVEIPRQLDLETLTLICVAPEEYWTKCIGLQGGPRVVKPEGWRSIGNLVGALQSKGFRVKYAKLTWSSVAPGGAPRGFSVEAITPWDEGKRKPSA